MRNPKPNNPIPAARASANEDSGIPAQWLRHYHSLQKIRAWLTSKHDEREAAIRVALDRGGTDFGDTATEEREHMDLLAKLTFSETELTEVEAALERIRLGTYGICEVTGQPIAPERLRAVPWTRLSHDAAERREGNVSSHHARI